jgi:hypothetical protein
MLIQDHVSDSFAHESEVLLMHRHLIVLHKDTTKANSESIAIDIKRLSAIWLS